MLRRDLFSVFFGVYTFHIEHRHEHRHKLRLECDFMSLKILHFFKSNPCRSSCSSVDARLGVG